MRNEKFRLAGVMTSPKGVMVADYMRACEVKTASFAEGPPRPE